LLLSITLLLAAGREYLSPAQTEEDVPKFLAPEVEHVVFFKSEVYLKKEKESEKDTESSL